MKRLSPTRVQEFQNKILTYYKTHARIHLPWRTHQTPYYVLVSEIMLQQTQVGRVIVKFNEFIKRVPTLEKLSNLSQKKLLTLWQGLGYNSRALRLQHAAQEITTKHKGVIPKEKEVLLVLPGIGPYTAGAIRVFAYNLPDIVLETNIRRVFIHEFFKKKNNISDTEIVSLIKQTLPKQNSRKWYEALMDYGATLPKILKSNPNTQSKHYKKQNKFSGSDRELRGKILRLALSGKKITPQKLGETLKRTQKIVLSLRKEGFEV